MRKCVNNNGVINECTENTINNTYTIHDNNNASCNKDNRPCLARIIMRLPITGT